MPDTQELTQRIAVVEQKIKHLEAGQFVDLPKDVTIDEVRRPRCLDVLDLPPGALQNKTPGRLVLLTVLAGFQESYSLVSQILDQARAAAMAGFDTHVVVMAHVGQKALPEIEGVTWHRAVPHCKWKEDEIIEEDVDKLKQWLIDFMTEMAPCTILAHDLIFQSWYVSFAKAIHTLDDKFDTIQDLKWVHQVHSSVSSRPTSPEAAFRSALPKNHRLAAINYTDIPKLSRYYQCSKDDILVLPNTRDIRTAWGKKDDHLDRLLDVTELHRRDVTQVYPLSTPRAEAKGLQHVMALFADLKTGGQKVGLLIANAHANGEGPEAVIGRLDEIAKDLGLVEGVDYWWSSKIIRELRTDGVPRETLRSLFDVTNIFAFPSASEACGLVMLEAAQTGNLLVLNQNLQVMRDFFGQEALWWSWPTIHKLAQDGDLRVLRNTILEHLARSSTQQARRRVAQYHSLEAIRDRLLYYFA